MQNKIMEIEGVIVKTLPNANFKVKLENNKEIIAHISGRIRKNYIKILIGDLVKVQISSYDVTKGRIIYRYINNKIKKN